MLSCECGSIVADNNDICAWCQLFTQIIRIVGNIIIFFFFFSLFSLQSVRLSQHSTTILSSDVNMLENIQITSGFRNNCNGRVKPSCFSYQTNRKLNNDDHNYESVTKLTLYVSRTRMYVWRTFNQSYDWYQSVARMQSEVFGFFVIS